MKTKMILETLALAALVAAGQAQAAPISLQGATITATYNAGNVLGLDQGFQDIAGSNTTALDPTDSGVEFITADYLFAFDFSNSGVLTVYNNGPVPAGTYSFTFDFNASLAQPVTSFGLLDTSAIGGMPALSVLSNHSIGLDLSNVTWNPDFMPFTTQIGTAAAVPEPGSAALLLVGVAGFAASRRKRARQA
jgi:hypothetical protein